MEVRVEAHKLPQIDTLGLSIQTYRDRQIACERAIKLPGLYRPSRRFAVLVLHP